MGLLLTDGSQGEEIEVLSNPFISGMKVLFVRLHKTARKVFPPCHLLLWIKNFIAWDIFLPSLPFVLLVTLVFIFETN